MKKKKAKKNIDYQARRERIENLKTMFLSLFSNQRAIDAGTHNPWWAALIVFVLAVFVPIIPMLTTGFTTSGSDIVSKETKGFDVNATRFFSDLANKGINLEVNGDHKLVDVDQLWDKEYGYNVEDASKTYNHVNAHTKEYELIAYYSANTGKTFETYYKKMLDKRYVAGSTTVYVEPEITDKPSENKDSSTSEEKPVETYRPTTIILNSESFMVQFYDNLGKPVSSFGGDYIKVTPGYKLQDIAKVDGKIGNVNDQEYVKAVFDQTKTFMNASYLNRRNFQVMVQTLTAAGIYVGLGFFMGLMIFLLTRGKRNLNRRFTFLQCQKMQAWAMLCPGILGMIMGFIVPNSAIMFFIIFLGVRIMWMSMKQLRPQVR